MHLFGIYRSIEREEPYLDVIGLDKVELIESKRHGTLERKPVRVQNFQEASKSSSDLRH